MEQLSPRKNFFVMAIMTILGISFLLFFFTGYTALAWAWVHSDLQKAMPYLPWARNFGMLGLIFATVAFAILFAPSRFPLPPKTRLHLSLLATVTIGFFAEFRNDGKFHLKEHVHFFGPETWVYQALNQLFTSLGELFYTLEYSFFNDFLMGPAIVCVLYPLVFLRIYGAVTNPTLSIGMSDRKSSSDLEQALRFARIIMNVGLFWLFSSGWGEKADFIRNPHSSDQHDFSPEFGGTMLAFWMIRTLTMSFEKRTESFRSTLKIDLISTLIIGAIYTLVISNLTENIASAVAHSIYTDIPRSLKLSEYTKFQQHLRPLELLVLAGLMWLSLNKTMRYETLTLLSSDEAEPKAVSKWRGPLIIGVTFGAVAACLVVWWVIISLLEQFGIDEPLWIAVAGIGTGFAGFLLARRSSHKELTTVMSTAARE